MNLSDHTLFLHIDDDVMAEVCLEALLGKSFEIVAVAEGEEGKALLSNALDWVLVDFDIPDDGVEAFIRSEGRLNDRHRFAVLSGTTVGLIAWEKLHDLSRSEMRNQRMDAQTFLSHFSGKAMEKITTEGEA
jgi:hypothetical protein